MNRLTEYRFAEPPVPSGFVACCLPTLVAAGQIGFVAAVYQMAAEQTRQQLAPPRPSRLPAFSRN